MTTAGPANSKTDSRGSRTYAWTNGGATEFYQSVTTLISGGLPKPALMYWAARQSAEFAVKSRDSWTGLAEDEAIDLIRTAHTRSRDRAADAGQAIHKLIEARILGTPEPDVPADLRPTMEQFARFEDRLKPDWRASEVTVYSRTHGYAGTLDAFVVVETLGEGLGLLDVKTGKGIYPDNALQLNAYANADFIGLDGVEHALPEIAWAGLLHLRPKSHRLVPVELSDRVFESFLAVREVCQWARGIAEDRDVPVLGDAIKTEGERAAVLRQALADFAPNSEEAAADARARGDEAA